MRSLSKERKKVSGRNDCEGPRTPPWGRLRAIEVIAELMQQQFSMEGERRKRKPTLLEAGRTSSTRTKRAPPYQSMPERKKAEEKRLETTNVIMIIKRPGYGDAGEKSTAPTRKSHGWRAEDALLRRNP